ncbi:MAG: haloacid dehalogenase-like hydrolase [Oscillospiraceae bacterium]|jgi:phosphoserine phosphatase|nr:haloacid dehalogenase-like hydrolase [Oscillospiraceae bacterium]
MNVFDFDGTIYAGDSTADFTLYCLARQPRILLALPQWARGLASALNALRTDRAARDMTALKERLYAYLPLVRDMPGTLDRFWSTHGRKLYPWYLEMKRPDDVIISAGPRFLLEPVCRELGVSLIASEVEPSTGRCSSRNCRGSVKAERFMETYPGAVIDAFYSDSMSDLPMARLAQRAYLARYGRVRDWPL